MDQKKKQKLMQKREEEKKIVAQKVTEKKEKIGSLRTKLLMFTSILVIVSLLVVSTTIILLEYRSTSQLLEQSLTETAQLAAVRVVQEMETYEAIARDAGMASELSSQNNGDTYKKQVIDARVKAYGLEHGNILRTSGISIFDGNNYADRDYFKQALAGNVVVSEPIISKVTGEMSIIVAAPLWQNGVANSTVAGVVYFVPKETFLSDVMSTVSVSKSCEPFMLTSDGTLIAATDVSLIKKEIDLLDVTAADKQLKLENALLQKMCAGETGYGLYRDENNVVKVMAYAPLNDGSGWSIAISSDYSDFMAGASESFYISLVLLLVSIAVSTLIGRSVTERISDPVIACAKRLEKLSQGDLHSAVPTTKEKNEVATLCLATKQIVEALNGVIHDTEQSRSALEEGNLAAEIGTSFPGDLSALRNSLVHIFASLNDTMAQINQASGQVSNGADQVSAGAQALSQGATEQASSIQELSATINEVSVKVKDNAAHAVEARDKTNAAGEVVVQNNAQMQDMIAAMNDIEEKSKQIGKIIKSIDDIAFQTNILALNAAVEAARAGAAGKGFAVVAEEVRNLAGKSAESAKSTASLIADTVSSVEHGVKLANTAAASMQDVMEGAQTVTKLVNKIAEDSGEQATAIAQVNLGVEQISSVVQTNSATAEESAAASEELSSQAQLMKNLVGHFTLQEEKPEQNAAAVSEPEQNVAYAETQAMPEKPWQGQEPDTDRPLAHDKY